MGPRPEKPFIPVANRPFGSLVGIYPMEIQLETGRRDTHAAPAAAAAPLRDQLPATWFPLMRSADLAPGRCRAVAFMGEPWVAFRDREGRPGLIRRYCSHMGADLSQGKVVDAHLVCALHKWRFDRDGKCATPRPEGPPACAHLPSARIEEWGGILFAHPGGEPGFRLAEVLSGPAEFSSATELEVPFHWLLAAVNTFDPSHYQSIHHRRLTRAPQLVRDEPWLLGIRYTARVIPRRWFDLLLAAIGASETEIEIDCWGAALLVMRNLRTGIGLVIAAAPMSAERSRVFVAAFGRATAGGPGPARRLALEVGRIFGISFLKEDIPFMRGMLPHPGALIPGQDDAAMAFWDYFRGLPKAGSP
jgi:nitrite reductase/ring-hydroxylating ferredoxin subunit